MMFRFWKALCPVSAMAAWLLLQVGAYGQSASEAQGFEARGDWAGAERVWRELIKKEPGDYRLWASLGITLSREQRYADAVDAYRRALGLHPGDAQTELNLGITYFKWGRLPDAVPPLRSATATLGDTHQTDLLLGMSLYGTGKYREAVSYLARACEEDAQNSELHSTLAQSYLHSGQYDEAMAEFKRMLMADPDSPAIHMLLGEAYDAKNQGEQAIEEFRLAAAHNYVPNAHFGLGYLLWKAHRYDEAAAEFQKELDNDRDNSQSLAYLGDIALKQQHKPKSEELLRRSLALGTDNRLVYLDLATIEIDNGQYASAEGHLKRAIGLNREEPDAHYKLARVYSATGRHTDANRELALVKQLHESTRDDLLLKISGSSEALKH